MNTTLFIHIGIPKTGTTTIQNFLASNRISLGLFGVLYPGNDQNHYPITQELRENEKPYLNTESYIFSIFSEIFHGIGKYQTIIISSEGFCESDDILLPRLIDCLSFFKINIPIKIIIYYRNQISWLESAYQQIVKETKARYELSFENFIENNDQFQVCDYYLRLHQWSNYFGKENILILSFESKQSTNKLFIDLFNAIGLKNFNSFNNQFFNKQNKGLSNYTIDFLRYLNLFKINNLDFEKIISVFKADPDLQSTDYMFLTPELENKIVEYFYESNQKFAVEFLNSKDGLLFADNKPKTIRKEIYNQHLLLNPIHLDFLCQKLSNKDFHLLEIMYKHIHSINSPNMEIYIAKQSFLNRLKKFISAEKLKLIEWNLPKVNHEDAIIIEMIRDWNTIHRINYLNFNALTSDFCNDLDKKIRVVDKLVYIFANNSDPYFSLQKHLGNYESATSVTITLTVPVETTIQLFFQTRSDLNYSEENSIKRIIKKGANKVYFLIEHDEFNGQIRIDPGMERGEYILKEILIKSNTKSYDELYEEYIKIRKNNF